MICSLVAAAKEADYERNTQPRPGAGIKPGRQDSRKEGSGASLDCQLEGRYAREAGALRWWLGALKQ